MTNSVRIVPAVLTDDPEALKSLLRQAESFTDFVQIDIMDGQFVPSRSITWKDLLNIKTTLDWEVHLMIKNPEPELENYKKAGANKAVFHFEAAENPRRVIRAARELGMAVGLAVNPETPIRNILPLTDLVDSILFLSVHPGFYGAKFIPEVMDKIKELRMALPQLRTGIDGGIKENNVISIAKSGVNDICVGSAVFLQPDPGEAYRKLTALVNSMIL